MANKYKLSSYVKDFDILTIQVILEFKQNGSNNVSPR